MFAQSMAFGIASILSSLNGIQTGDDTAHNLESQMMVEGLPWGPWPDGRGISGAWSGKEPRASLLVLSKAVCQSIIIVF